MTDQGEEPIDLSDPELEKAATKIQATFKGFKARKEIREGEGEGSPGQKQEEVRVLVLCLNESLIRKSSISRLTINFSRFLHVLSLLFLFFLFMFDQKEECDRKTKEASG